MMLDRGNRIPLLFCVQFHTPTGIVNSGALSRSPHPWIRPANRFRTMHASLMRRFGARLEVARDNMGHAGSTGGITLDVYSKTWWDERVDV
jgi:hypothetical protein